MNVGDYLVHEQEDGKFAFHSYETWRDRSAPLRPLFITFDEARTVAKAAASATGGSAWRSLWQTPDQFVPLP